MAASDLSGAGWLRVHALRRWLEKVRADGLQPILVGPAGTATIREAQKARQRADFDARVARAEEAVARSLAPSPRPLPERTAP